MLAAASTVSLTPSSAKRRRDVLGDDVPTIFGQQMHVVRCLRLEDHKRVLMLRSSHKMHGWSLLALEVPQRGRLRDAGHFRSDSRPSLSSTPPSLPTPSLPNTLPHPLQHPPQYPTHTPRHTDTGPHHNVCVFCKCVLFLFFFEFLRRTSPPPEPPSAGTTQNFAPFFPSPLPLFFNACESRKNSQFDKKTRQSLAAGRAHPNNPACLDSCSTPTAVGVSPTRHVLSATRATTPLTKTRELQTCTFEGSRRLKHHQNLENLGPTPSGPTTPSACPTPSGCPHPPTHFGSPHHFGDYSYENFGPFSPNLQKKRLSDICCCSTKVWPN